MYQALRVTGILLAGGSGSRFGGAVNKVYQDMRGRPVLSYSLEVMSKSRLIDDIIIVCRQGEEDVPRRICESLGLDKPYRLVHGGGTRQESVYNALKAGCGQAVVIQDGARPFITEEYIARCLKALDVEAPVADMPDMEAPAADLPDMEAPAAEVPAAEASAAEASAAEAPAVEALEIKAIVQGSAAAVRAKDTIKLTDSTGLVEETVPRERAWQVQTPQCFMTAPLLAAHERFRCTPGITDDCMLIEMAGGRIRLVEGDYRNIKITTPEDMLLAESFIIP